MNRRDELDTRLQTGTPPKAPHIAVGNQPQETMS